MIALNRSLSPPCLFILSTSLTNRVVGLGVNVSTLTRWLQLRSQTGSFEPRPHGGGTAPTLDQDGLDRLRKLVKENPDDELSLRQSE